MLQLSSLYVCTVLNAGHKFVAHNTVHRLAASPAVVRTCYISCPILLVELPLPQAADADWVCSAIKVPEFFCSSLPWWLFRATCRTLKYLLIIILRNNDLLQNLIFLLLKRKMLHVCRNSSITNI